MGKTYCLNPACLSEVSEEGHLCKHCSQIVKYGIDLSSHPDYTIITDEKGEHHIIQNSDLLKEYRKSAEKANRYKNLMKIWRKT